MRLLLVLVALCLCFASTRSKAADPAIDTTDTGAWTPMAGSKAVTLQEIDGRKVLRMPCNFKGTTIDRASWDRSVQLDMNDCQGLRFRVMCPNSDPVNQFNIYFQSGDGWYTANFAPGSAGKWSTVEVSKESTSIEGKPAGWGSIKAIRVSAWRSKDQDTELLLSDMERFGTNAPVRVVRGESASQARSEYTEIMCGMLQELGVSYSMVSDQDLTADRLQGAKLLILPMNPTLPAGVAGVVNGFVQSGGKVMVFYSLPQELAGAVGVHEVRHLVEPKPGFFASIRAANGGLQAMPEMAHQHSWNIQEVKPAPGAKVVAEWFDQQGNNTGKPAVVASATGMYMSHVLLGDDAPAKRQLLMAMVGTLYPDAWKQAATAVVQGIGKIGPYEDFEAAQRAIAAAGPKTAAAMQQAAAGRAKAADLLKSGQYGPAIAAAGEANRELLKAYCAAQPSKSGEHRAFWCHSAFGVAGMSWDQAIRELAENGFTAIHPNMLWGGVAFYESKVLPVAAEVKARGDQIAECLAACRKYGIECHVWKVNWNMGWSVSKEFVDRMRNAGRTQVSFDGTANDHWLCPSHPENQQLEIDAMVEVATKYDVDGIHFDYIRYPGPEGCFCSGCRERFEKVLGRKVANWPADTRNEADMRARWLDFRRDNITRVVAGVSDRVRPARPKMQISAAVFSNWSVDRDSVGQDWKLWCERGYMDFVCPMDYTASTGQFEDMVRRQLVWAGKAKLYPGIGLSTWPGAQRDTAKLIEQIQVTRKLGCPGFTIFEYGTAEARDVVPMCGLGVTSGK